MKALMTILATLLVATSEFSSEMNEIDEKNFAAKVVKLECGAKSETTGITSQYTSTLDKDCWKVEFSMLRRFTNAESAFECPAPKGWRLFKLYDRDSERSWLNVAKDHDVWSTADQVRINRKYFFGYFPNIDYSPHVEWRHSDGSITALIFRVAVTDPKPVKPGGPELTRLYIIGLKGKEPRFCGTANTNKEAREIADKTTICTEPLLKEPIRL